MQFDWATPPYDHKWTQNRMSFMSPGTKVTFPQFIVEMVVFNRSQYFKNYHPIVKGPGWSVPLGNEYKVLIRQANVICNYFQHPDEDPLVESAFRTYFRNFRVVSLGAYRKVRMSKGKCNVTDQEKTVIKGVALEVQRLHNQKSIFTQDNIDLSMYQNIRMVADAPKNETIQHKKIKPLSIKELIEREKQ